MYSGKWNEGRAEVSASGYKDTECPDQLVTQQVSALVPGCSDEHCLEAKQKAKAEMEEYLMNHDYYDAEGCIRHIYVFKGCGNGPRCT